MHIQARAVDSKQHTQGYKVSGRWMTRPNVVRLVRRGRIRGVGVRSGKQGEFIAALPDFPRLYDLPAMNTSKIRSRVFGGTRTRSRR
tara:strand:+ start:44 stop:304 length:261 start_codon:yes stop_codon:yes gene_type:complete